MQFDKLKRREFITLIGGGAAAALPIAAQAQQPGKVYMIGRITAGEPAPHLRDAFVDSLRALGWIEGRNVVYIRRSSRRRAAGFGGMSTLSPSS
jgi:putative ABC transport system substrate-binding protein